MKKVIAIGLLVVAMLVSTGYEHNAIETENLTISQYTGLVVNLPEQPEITDEQVQAEIDSLLAANSQKNAVTDRAAQPGDWVNIDYTGLIDGVAFEGGTAAGYNLELGSGRFIPGFEDLIVGHSVGEQFEFDLAFPSPYEQDPSKAGVTAHWVITLHEIYQMASPELTDEFVREMIALEGITTAEEFREYVRGQLEAQVSAESSNSLAQAAWAALEPNVTIIKYPQDQLDKMVDELTSSYTEAAQNEGLSLEEYATSKLGKSMDELNTQIQTNAENYVKQEMVLTAIAEKEDLLIDDSYYRDHLDEFAVSYGFTGGEDIASKYPEEQIRSVMQEQRVLRFIADNRGDGSNPDESVQEEAKAIARKIPVWAWAVAAVVVLLVVFMILKGASTKKRRKQAEKRRKKRSQEE